MCDFCAVDGEQRNTQWFVYDQMRLMAVFRRMRSHSYSGRSSKVGQLTAGRRNSKHSKCAV